MIQHPAIVCVAPTGARKTTEDHPGLPVTPGAIAREAKACRDAGATMIHLHVRDKDQKHTLDAGIYREAIAEIRKQVGEDLIIQVTTEAIGIYTPEQQMALVQTLKPEAVSIAPRELMPEGAYTARVRKFLYDALSDGILVQYILYSPEDIHYFAKLKKLGIIPGKYNSVLFVLGKKTGNPEKDNNGWAEPKDLDPFIKAVFHESLAAETYWMTCAFGGNELACMQKAAEYGGHVRIGFENNHLLADGAVAPDNTSLIKQFCNSETSLNIASVEEARRLLSRTLLPEGGNHADIHLAHPAA